MRVSRLEIFGFKSFVERFALNFDKNVIGIVGPNGCGKSNIVDSLRWVLGETHAKQLRGSSLEDLIFNGSDSRRPLGMCEVSITIRPDDGWSNSLLPESGSANVESKDDISAAVNSDDSELATIDSTAEESENGLSEGETSRLVVEGESLPEAQEELDVVGVKLDEDDSESSIVPSSLMAIPGLFDAAEIQLTRRLYRSGESEYFINRIPCRLRDMTDIYRLIGLGSRGLSIVQQGQIGELISKKPIERRELLEEAAGISGFRTRMEAAQRKLKKTNENLSRLSDIIVEVEKQVRSLKRQASRARARNDLKLEITEIDHELFKTRASGILVKKLDAVERRAGVLEELNAKKAEMAESDAEQEKFRSAIEELDVNLTALRRSRDEVYQTITAQRERLQEYRVEIARVEGRERSIAEEQERISINRQEGLAEITEKTDSIANKEREIVEAGERKLVAEQALELLRKSSEEEEVALREKFDRELVTSDVSERIEALTSEIDSLQPLGAQINNQEREVANARRALKDATGKLHADELKLASLKAEIDSLQEQLDMRTRHASESTLGSDPTSADAALNSDMNLQSMIDKPLAAGMNVPAHLETAVGAVLGERAHLLVSPAPDKVLAGYAKRKSDGDIGSERLGFITSSPSLTHESLAEPSAEELAIAPSITHLISQLELDESVASAVRVLAEDYYVVDTISEAHALSDMYRSNGEAGRYLVTKEGEVITPWGWYTTSGQGVELSFARRIDELSQKQLELIEVVEASKRGVAEAEAALQEVRDQLSVFLEQREGLQQKQRDLSNLLKEQRAEEARHQQRLRDMERERRERFRHEERTAVAAVQSVVAELNKLTHGVEFERNRIASISKQEQNLQERESKLEAELAELAERGESLRKELQGAAADESESQRRGLEDDFQRIEDSIREVEEQRASQTLALAEVSEKLAGYRREHDRLADIDRQSELAGDKLELELQMLFEDFSRSYEDNCALPEEVEARELCEALGDKLDSHVRDLQEQVGKLRRKLEREGEVDPQSIELYEQEQERLDSLKVQHADLESAVKILERTIRQLKQISKERFLETFTFVSGKFKELVPRLFGGGAGYLELLNPEDPLTSGVEIHVRPPGKKISNMELLSGGEKALVATAVLISMFLYRPGPICVLDEVDAPLDDANLERFLAVITEIAHRTQFLIITHNKVTMAAADRLLGITMQERGVSRALSVSFSEAEAEVEQWAANM
jgi:chromosome segregation protein